MILFLFFLAIFNRSPVDSLSSRLDVDTVFVDVDSQQIVISGTLKNNTNKNFLTYGLDIFGGGSDTDEYYCDGEGSASQFVFIYDDSGAQKYITISSEKGIYDDPVTSEDINAGLSKSRDNMIDSNQVIYPGDSINFVGELDLSSFNLKPGIYDIYVIYSSGKFLYDFLGVEIINTHQKKLNAQLFQGCIKSNTVKLVVK